MFQVFSAYMTAFPSVISYLSSEQLASIDMEPPTDDLVNKVNSLRLPTFDASSRLIPDTEIRVYNTTAFCEAVSGNSAASPPAAVLPTSSAAPESAAGATHRDATATATELCDGRAQGLQQCGVCAAKVVQAATGSELAQLLQPPAQQVCNQVIELDPSVKCATLCCVRALSDSVRHLRTRRSVCMAVASNGLTTSGTGHHLL